MRRLLAALPLLSLVACQAPEERHAKVIIGAVLIDGLGGPPVSNSVIVVAGGEIREAGPSSDIPIPAEADKIDGAGRFVVPALVDVCPSANPPGMVRASTAEDARTQVAALQRAKAPAIYLAELPAAVAQAALEAARDAGIPVLARASTQAEARLLADQGASGIVGMIRDTADLDPVLVTRWRNLRIVFAPALSELPPGPELEIARRNTRALFAAGVPLALASIGGDPLREAEALSDAGIPPLDVLVAATRNGALALHQSDRGTIQTGRRADLLLLPADPGADIRNLRRPAARIVAGEIVQK